MQHTTIVMSYDENVLYVQFIYGHHETANDTVKATACRIACYFNDIGIAPFEAQSRFQQIQEPRIHAG